MDCTINNLQLPFDKGGRLAKTVNRVSNGDTQKVYTLAAFLSDKGFHEYIKDKLADKDYLSGQIIDTAAITENDMIKINQNRLGKLLNDYYLETFKSVQNSKTHKGLGFLNGFSSASAKSVAKKYNSIILVHAYQENQKLPKNRRKTPIELVAQINEEMTATLHRRATVFANEVLIDDRYSDEAKQSAQEYLVQVDKTEAINKEINELNDKIAAKRKERNDAANEGKEILAKLREAKKANDKPTFVALNKERTKAAERVNAINDEINAFIPLIEDINKRAAIIVRDKYAAAQNLVYGHANSVDKTIGVRLTNFANLVDQARGNADAWYFQVFHSKAMASAVRDFSRLGDIEEYLEENDGNGENTESKYANESIDESSKSWEDSMYRSFNQAIDRDVKVVLSTLPKLADKFNPTEETQAVDTNNELGVPDYMDAQVVAIQLYSFRDASNVEAMIDSIQELADRVKSLYGLGRLAHMMRNNPAFANKVFVSFAKPVADKVMIEVAPNSQQGDGIGFAISNQGARPTTELIYRFSNQIKSSYTTVDHNVIKANLSKLNNSWLKNHNLDEVKDVIYDSLVQYFPTIKRDVVDAVVDGLANSNVPDGIDNLIRTVYNIAAYTDKHVENLYAKATADEAKNRRDYIVYRKEVEEWAKLPTSVRKETPKPNLPKRNYTSYVSEDISKTMASNIIALSKLITNYTETKARLNSPNAEGSSASDIMKNSYISRLFEKIEYGTETDAEAGLKSLLAYVTQGIRGANDVNQYSNNPILFGVTDRNGKVLVPGIFQRIGDVFTINPNAKEVIKVALFDGIKSDAGGSTYSKMSKLDFFIAQYKAFTQSYATATDDAMTSTVNGYPTAAYVMRVASDAPKTFMIRSYVLNNHELKLAFKGHVMDEINMMLKGLTALFNQQIGDRFDMRTDIDGLIGRAFFDERVAAGIKNKNGTDFTDAIVKNGRLRGNLFAFNRLFNTNGYDAGAEISRVLSLYGGVGTNSIINTGTDGSLSITPNDVIIHNGTEFVLNLSDEQHVAIEKIVDAWMNNFVEEITARTSEFMKVLKDNNIQADASTVRSFILNGANMNMNYDDLFEGDFKFYTNTRDFLKRTKETQAGGDGYAGYRIDENHANGIVPETANGVVKHVQIEGMDVLVNGKPIDIQNGWRGVTIYNTVRPSSNAEGIYETLYKQFIAEGRPEDEAKAKAAKYAAGYGYDGGDTTKVNDAQSYITLEEFIRRRYLDGTIDEYADLIKKLTDDTSVYDIDVDAVNARIQVQKNFYYDKQFDAATGLYYPRQIKNAEFVLIPKLLPEGSELRKVYDWMSANGIGQLDTAETSKAAKKNIFAIWDARTGKFNEDFAAKFNPAHTEQYFYQYLYKQQNVQQHMEDEHNKAGIQIMKKIIDNIISESNADDPNRAHLVQLANDFQNAFAANIEESFQDFLAEVGWEYDTDMQQFVNANYATTDSQGNPLSNEEIQHNRTKLNFSEFLAKGREEMSRLGLDGNMLDYFITDEFGKAIMPNFMNIAATKLESIAQSIYNNRITRQTLPGWHAAQITDVGYDKHLNFNPETGVMEVYLPRWSRLIPRGKNAEEDAAILKQIEEEGLDIHIAYRMPTEGKQSISIIKVVGFTNDILGSTIVVPEEWVTQTGSDFDVDSVYGISWEINSKKDKNGKVHLSKVPYTEETVDNEQLYFKYVRNKLNLKVRKTDIGQELNDELTALKDRLNNTEARNANNSAWKTLHESRNEAFLELPISLRNHLANSMRKGRKEGKTLKEIYEDLYAIAVRALENSKDSSAVPAIQSYVSYQQGILNIIAAQEGYEAFDATVFHKEKKEIVDRLIAEAKETYKREIIEAAAAHGLESFEEWSKRPLVYRLDRRARNNYLIDKMIAIMNDPSSREEQYGRSNFEAITNGQDGANDIVDRLYKKEKQARSPYNPLDQLDYFEDAMGGARLKAMSVAWDNFISKNNRVRTELPEHMAIRVQLYKGPVKDSSIAYNFNDIAKSYGNDFASNTGIYTARKLGWSYDNHNTVGSFVTTYTASTTAHHLDAVKMGSVPNVDEYTFATYKLLSSLGIDFETIISFIRQPIITKLVANNNLINSLFISDNSNAIKKTFVDIAESYGMDGVNEYTPLMDVIKGFAGYRYITDAISKLYGIDISNMDVKDILKLNVPLDKFKFFSRIQAEVGNIDMDTFEIVAHDFITLITFNRIQRIASHVNKYVVNTNADKHGAKKDINSTREIIKNVNDLTELTSNEGPITLYNSDGNFMGNFYTPIGSRYPSINAVYQRTTVASVQTNSELFTTENEDFVDMKQRLAGAIGRKVTNAEWPIFKKYAVASIYEQLDWVTGETASIDDYESNWNKEYARVLGYGVIDDGNLQVDDINNPTEEEVEAFKGLTPVQKVLFIQKHFADDAGIFEYIKTTSYNANDYKRKGITRQYMSYDDQIDGIDDLYSLFESAFSNHNPLIKEAAIDLIKYSFVAEHYEMKTGYISKIIPNSVLRYGEGIVVGSSVTKQAERLISYYSEEDYKDKIIEQFVRSHSSMLRIANIPRPSNYPSGAIGNAFNSVLRKDGIVHIDTTRLTGAMASLYEKLNLGKGGDYVRVNKKGANDTSRVILFKIVRTNPILDANNKFVGYADIFLYPINTLDTTEIQEYSYNTNNNLYNSAEEYDTTIRELSARAMELRSANVKSAANLELKRTQPGEFNPVGGYVADAAYKSDDVNALMKMASSSDKYIKGGAEKLINGIINHYTQNPGTQATEVYAQLNNNSSLRLIFPDNVDVNQDIVTPDGEVISLTIKKYPNTERFRQTLNKLAKDPTKYPEYEQVLHDIVASRIQVSRANVYKVTLRKLTQDEIIEAVDETTKMNAITDLIDDADANAQTGLNEIPRRGNPIDVVSSAIISEAHYASRRDHSTIASRFMKEIQKARVNPTLRGSLADNRGAIYKAAARYYRSAAATIINSLNEFVLDGETYSMDETAFYEALANHDEMFAEVANVILAGITFGNRIKDIITLDISEEDADVQKHVVEIINTINSVRNNKKLADALDKIMNVYFKKFSNNPNIIEGVIKLRDTFGDIDAIHRWISDPADIANNEVQVVLKQVYAMFDKAEMFQTKRNVQEWKDAIAEIEKMEGSIDMDKIIDSQRGRIRFAHNERFLEDKQKLESDYNETKAAKMDSLDAYERYFRAKLALDEFRAKYTEQHIVEDYYKAELEARRLALRLGGRSFIQYLMLNDRLYNSTFDAAMTAEEVDKEKSRIISQMNAIRSEVDMGGNVKSDEGIMAAKAITKYIETKRRINAEYFDSQEYDGFTETYKKYKQFVDTYNAGHKYDSLEKKLANSEEYKEAYYWIKTNGRIRFSDEQSAKLKEAFKILTKSERAISKDLMYRLKLVPGAVDANGNINPTVLTPEQIAFVKKQFENELTVMYDNGRGESMLIRDIPADIPLIDYTKLPPKVVDDITYSNNPEKFRIIGEINKILSKVVDKDSGSINVAAMFNNDIVSDEERIRLANLYNQLRGLRKTNTRSKVNKYYTEKHNTAAYLNAINYYRNNLANTAQGKQFLDIFTEFDENGNMSYNFYIFGYREPVPEVVHVEKTAARDYIKDNVQFVETEHYYVALNEAAEKGEEAYEEWYKANHIYNPYTHRYEPLRIWTKLEAKPNSELNNSIEYRPTFDNMERNVKAQYVNPNYGRFGNGYKAGNAEYDSPIKLNAKEQAMRDLYIKTLTKYASTYQGQRFVQQGYLPRERQITHDGRWVAEQVGSLFGLSWRSGRDSDSFHEQVDYSHDRYADMDMLALLKTKGTRKYEPIPAQGNMSDAEYQKALEAVRKRNREIAAENERLDNAILNRNWPVVMENFIHNATVFNARQAAKPYLYLLLEDLNVNDAYMVKGILGDRLVKDKVNSTADDTRYRKEKQVNSREAVHTLARRLLFRQYHENSRPRAIANFLQNMTSAKYMVFNLYGGIANITTGHTNINAEIFANEYFGAKDIANAEREILSDTPRLIAEMWSDKASSMTGALIKHFGVVDIDQVLQFGDGSANLDEGIKRLRNFTYGFQSAGEYLMQNSVLIAMLNSNRLFINSRGNRQIGDFKDYIWNLEQTAMKSIVEGNKILSERYNAYLNLIKYDVAEQMESDAGKVDFNLRFLQSLKDSNDEATKALYKKTVEAYVKKRDELTKEAKVEFNKQPTVRSLFEFKNGHAALKQSAIADFNKLGKNKTGDLEHLVSEFRRKVKKVNDKIHGVYDKDAAATLETKWFGSLLMQYHKHLYTGIMKRFRRKGYFSEFRGSRERGFYLTLADFLGMEFTNLDARIKQKQGLPEGENAPIDPSVVIASIQVVAQSALNTIRHLSFNYKQLSNWQRANVRRTLGELGSVLVACLIVMALFGGWDDDEVKDDTFKASMLYLADRLYSETTMYTPVGLVSEYKTMWSSPVAAANGPSDMMKALTLIPQALFDPDYNPNYKTGRYAGKNKIETIIKRNIPGVRPYEAIAGITKNASYYKIGESQIGISLAKNFGESLRE